MRPVIKVCGIRSEAEAIGAVSAGANTIGVLLGLTHLSQDETTPELAARIVAAVPERVRTVVVTHLLDPRAVAAMALQAGVGAVQVHGEMPVKGLSELRGLLPAMELIKAIHVMDDLALRAAEAYAPWADMLLLDSRTAERLGGTGLTHDWTISRRIVESVDIPVVLAGGLNPENVERAIERVRPAGVDANSGLEHADGSKDFAKIRRFALSSRRALALVD